MGPVRIFFHNIPHYVLKSITWPYKPKKMVRYAGKCPTTPLWKLGPPRLLWPKIGHWEKMRYMLKMISTGLFAIDLALIYPKHNPEGPWHPPDTQQTPHRHLPDSVKYTFFGWKWATGRKWNTCLKQWSLDCFQLILCFYLPDNIQTPPDTI